MSTIQFNSPRLFIADYYDSLINQIDIYTEKELKRTKNIRLNKPEPIELNGYSSDYNYDNVAERIKVDPEVTTLHDYLNLARQNIIDEIRKVQQHNLDAYEQNKSSYNINKDGISEEELKSRLFKDKFCFLLKIEIKTVRNRINSSPFKLYAVITDFYLSQSDLELLNEFIEDRFPIIYHGFGNKRNLTEKTLLVYLMNQYIIGLVETQKYGHEVIEINKDSLLAVEKIYILYPKAIDLGSTELDFSMIKSLSIIFHVDNSIDMQQFKLKALSYLECLELHNLNSINSIFDSENLAWTNLKHLSVFNCPKFNLRNFSKCDYLSNLENLDLSANTLEKLEPFQFVKLKNLRVLDLSENQIRLVKSYVFFGLSQLNVLVLKSAIKSYKYRSSLCSSAVFEKNAFAGLENLTDLDLSNNDKLESTIAVLNDLSRHSPKLERLNLEQTFLDTLSKNMFSPFVHLKWINLMYCYWLYKEDPEDLYEYLKSLNISVHYL